MADKIRDIKTFLVDARSRQGFSGGWRARNWLFVKVETEEGLYGLGESSGWPTVIQTAIEDLKPTLIGEDPTRIERIWQRMQLGMMGHGMTGVVGAGAMTGIEIALWDILGKRLGAPVCDLLGGMVREKIRVYAHANTVDRALELKDRGYTALKAGGTANSVGIIRDLRKALPDEFDLCIDVHGPPWFTVPDAIRVGQELEEYDLLFYEEPVAPENYDSLAKVAAAVNVPIAAGERAATVYGLRELIERDIVDVIQPDTGRAGGLMQMKKMAAQAEAHHIMMAPHDGSNGPIAEAAAVHLLASIPNCLILEHLVDDVPWRYEVATELKVVDSFIAVPRRPGLGIELDEAIALAHPGQPNITPPKDEIVAYVEPRFGRRKLFRP
jgi:galactonate dehydratase